MRHEQHRAVELLDRGLEHLDRVDVEVVGGLVQHQAVRARAHQQQQLEPRALAAGERVHLLAALLVAEQEPQQRRDGLLLGARPLRPQRVHRGLARGRRRVLLGQKADLDRRPHPASLPRTAGARRRGASPARSCPSRCRRSRRRARRGTPSGRRRSAPARRRTRPRRRATPPPACRRAAWLRSRSAILRRSSTGRSTLSMRSMRRSVLRALIVWRRSSTMLAHCL